MIDKLQNFYEAHKIGILVYILIHLATYYLFVHKLGKNHLKNYKDPRIKEKGLETFNRPDVENMSLFKCLPMILTFWPRWFLLSVVFYGYIMYILLLVTVLPMEFL